MHFARYTCRGIWTRKPILISSAMPSRLEENNDNAIYVMAFFTGIQELLASSTTARRSPLDKDQSFLWCIIKATDAALAALERRQKGGLAEQVFLSMRVLCVCLRSFREGSIFCRMWWKALNILHERYK